MRDILFRGFYPDEDGKEKVFVNGEWIKGFWVYGYYVLVNIKKHRIYTGEYFGEYNLDYYVVIPETVGQYTGLKDKNGTRIFEGDIVDILNCEYIPWVVDKTKLKVEWCNDPTGFYPFCSYGNYVDSEYVEVIGNIFENPELIENAPK